MDLTIEALEKAIKDINKHLKDSGEVMSIQPTWVWVSEPVKEKPKMYKITLDGRRYNNKNFTDYESARKYVRRLVTKIWGKYTDDYTFLGFNIIK